MDALAQHGGGRHRRARRRWPLVVLAVVVVAVVAAGAGYLLGRPSSPPSSDRAGTRDAGQVGHVAPLAVAATDPTEGAQGVASNATLTVRFTTPVKNGAGLSLAPPVAGSWVSAGPRTLRFEATAPMIPGSSETLTVASGRSGVQGTKGQVLATPTTVHFSVASGSEERLEQLLAQTGYLPLTFTPSGPAPAPAAAAQPQAGAFNWRWPGLPSQLTSLWTEGTTSALTKGAVMTLQDQNHLTVDAIAGPQVWTVLLKDAAQGATNPGPWDYVLVSKALPENLTLWVNGQVKFSNVPVNTGVPGADTADGTFQVFEHVTASEMKGTNPDGSTYDDPNVPWASYFNGGDALHGFVRASYGFPQSNGCVEMSIADAGATWPYTPIGTLVTVEGPPAT
jgi:lipoprotein-anchoring transpeptidase ErfK/SrfK